MLFILIFFTYQTVLTSDAYARRDQTWRLKRYTLSGDIELSYDRKWFDESDEEEERFMQNYSLGLRGYLLDPRIFFFETKGFFRNDDYIDNGSDSFVGGDARVVLFGDVLNRGVLNYVPKPVTLRYSILDQEERKQTKYGVGLVYRRRGEAIKILSRNGLISLGPYKENRYANNNYNYNNNNNSSFKGFKIPFPEIYFDYDKYELEGKRNNVYDNDIEYYSTRLYSNGSKNRVTGEYTVRKDRGFAKYDREYLNLDHRYSRVLNETGDFIDIYNRYYFTVDESTEQEKREQHIYDHKGIWVENIGGSADESLRIDEGVTYNDINDNNDYSVRFGSTYDKPISNNLRDTVSISGGYSDGDMTEQRDSVGLSNALNLLLPDRSLIRQELSVTNNESGVDYGFLIGYTKARRHAYELVYSYNVHNVDDLRGIVHRYLGRVSGPVVRNISYWTIAEYRLSHTADNDDSFGERSFLYNFDLNWGFSRGKVTLGGSYAYSSTDNDESDSGSTEALYSTASYNFTRKLYVYLYARWEKDFRDNEQTLIQPRLHWSYRRFSVDMEYDYRKSEINGWTTTGHRFFVRLKRYFSQNLYF